MNGRTVGIALLVSGALAGVGMYWAQVHAFYDPVPMGAEDVRLTSVVSGMAEQVGYDNYKGIDAESSPLRYRACFDVSLSLATLTESYELYDNAEPLVGPGWFGCYDADEVGEALESGEALAFLGEANVVYGIDRVVAVFRDGRARSWHQINVCGEEVFDGQPAPDGCPEPPERS